MRDGRLADRARRSYRQLPLGVDDLQLTIAQKWQDIISQMKPVS